jgi:hypothetical protein
MPKKMSLRLQGNKNSDNISHLSSVAKIVSLEMSHQLKDDSAILSVFSLQQFADMDLF